VSIGITNISAITISSLAVCVNSIHSYGNFLKFFTGLLLFYSAANLGEYYQNSAVTQNVLYGFIFNIVGSFSAY
jgi:hypothetical protein